MLPTLLCFVVSARLPERTKEILCSGDQEDVFACYSSMLRESSPPTSRAAKRPPSCSSDSVGANDVADAASFSATPTGNSNNKRMRMELPEMDRR